MHQRFDCLARHSRQRGQAYAEYLVVTAALVGVILLMTGDTVAPFTALVSSFKSLFSAYSFTLSLP
ncbi:hypothetical protein LMG28727_06409 [Paraburkholderia kirstenboschensis]|uniref:hypothetical protein n=1 Tax=Paraburkholderia kirstenboschensis TaxID=1245436 RepID=UPI000B07574A|nr:hypothetical protein [Paraburkholderia kirstenboschensis]CAD6557664.1 hypothetical protein LMG28727_06409 [Paraburkholderia kirstenboschensis]